MFKKIIAIIFFMILAVLSFNKFSQNKYLDITQNKINSLSFETQKLLTKISQPISIQVYSPNINELTLYNSLLANYSKYSKLITTEPHQTESQKFLIINYKNHQTFLSLENLLLSEQQVSAAIQEAIGLKASDNSLTIFKHTTPKDLNYQQTKINKFLYNYGFTILLPLLLICLGFYLEPR